MIRNLEFRSGFFREPSFKKELQVGRNGEVIDEDSAVRAGEFRSGDGEGRGNECRGISGQSAEFRVQSSEFRVQCSEFRVRCSEFRVQSSVFRVQRSGKRLGLGVGDAVDLADADDLGHVGAAWFLEFGGHFSEEALEAGGCGLDGEDERGLACVAEGVDGAHGGEDG